MQSDNNANYHYQWCRVLLVCCESLDDLKAKWIELIPVMVEKLDPHQRYNLNFYKNKLKEKLSNQTAKK